MKLLFFFFTDFSRLKATLTESEINYTGVEKGVQRAVCGMHRSK